MAGVWIVLLAGAGMLGAAWRQMFQKKRRRAARESDGNRPLLPEDFPEGPLMPELPEVPSAEPGPSSV